MFLLKEVIELIGNILFVKNIKSSKNEDKTEK